MTTGQFSIWRKPSAIAVAVVLALSSFVSLALSQTNSESTAESGVEDTQKRPKIRFLPPAYDEQMLRLSEILGALHYLRELCGANEGQMWRDQMSSLIDAEEPSDARKAQMIANFNKGFRGFREIYRECTPVAAEAGNRYLRQGMRISGEIPDRYGR